VSPVLESLARDHAGKIKLVKVDVDASPRTAQRFEVQGVPSLLILDHGRVLTRRTGAAPRATLEAWLEEALAARDRT
jgi:thioredoxin 2